jgi:hypothetical protein
MTKDARQPSDEAGAPRVGRARLGLRPALLRAIICATGATILLTWVLYVAMSSGAVGAHGQFARLGGDFPAFYGAGLLVRQGRGQELYDVRAQQESQHEVWAHSKNPREYLMYAYPPAFAAPYAVVAALPYRGAYALHTCFMLAALGLSVFLLRSGFQIARDEPASVAFASLAVFPVFIGAFLGQNGLLSLALLTCSWRLAQRAQPLAAGMVAALLLFKPQLAIPWFGVLVLSRRWGAVPGFIFGAMLFYAACSLVAGPEWFSAWWSWAREFQRLDGELNGGSMISWPSVMEFAIPRSATRDFMTWIPLCCLAIPSVLTLARLRTRPAAQLALALPLMVFASPHALRYELALLVPTALFVGERSRPQLLAIVFLAMASEYTRWAGVACLVLSAGLVWWHASREHSLAAPTAVAA